MRSQQIAVVEPEGVLTLARRVVARDVEGVKVVVLGLHLGTVLPREAHRREQVDQLLLHDGDRVERADATSRTRLARVKAGGRKLALHRLRRNRGAARGERSLDVLLQLVESLAGCWPLALVKLADRAQELLQLALLAEKTRLNLRKRSLVRDSSDGRKPLTTTVLHRLSTGLAIKSPVRRRRAAVSARNLRAAARTGLEPGGLKNASDYKRTQLARACWACWQICSNILGSWMASSLSSLRFSLMPAFCTPWMNCE